MFRAIFLDFDGVSHPVSEIEDWRDLNLSKIDLDRLVEQRNLFRWLPALADALEEHQDVVIFVHSGWRGYADNMQIKRYLGALAPRFMGVTSSQAERYPGILEMASRAGLDSYRVIDDATHLFPAGCPELIITHPELGLSESRPLDELGAWLVETAQERSLPSPVAG